MRSPPRARRSTSGARSRWRWTPQNARPSSTQAARFSDDDLRIILTEGKKPEGVGFRILPPMLGSMTAEELYADFHTWEASEDEIVGLIMYLRSLTPTGQGDIRLPDGTYVPAGTTPAGFMNMTP
jgi:hypothetical protein